MEQKTNCTIEKYVEDVGHANLMDMGRNYPDVAVFDRFSKMMK